MLEKRDIEKIEKELISLDKKISKVAENIENKKKRFNFNDFIQEIAGAIILAFPFAANADIWEISKAMSKLHAFILLILIIFGLFIFINYSNLGNWKVQNLAGFLPLRLVTSFFISLTVSAISLLVLGIYPGIIDNTDWFIKTVILVTLFSVIGSIGLDAAK
ncbi:DUF2391 family protein [Desulfurobacterium thermolithotrophum]|uniref:DUF2391 family protein n=1 Tax=Desulfurobacterium thermolithotrophum TaxID=64160 RepID=UPI0005A2F73C|nr:DUF2391 family protein [Desulfurobacterium thermolithotrophum]